MRSEVTAEYDCLDLSRMQPHVHLKDALCSGVLILLHSVDLRIVRTS